MSSLTNTMTYETFIAKFAGKAIDYDGAAGVQCVDLAKMYLDYVFGIKVGAWGDAHSYYDEWTKYSSKLKENFYRIPNTPSFIPQKGDIAVWSPNLNGGWGHIAICTGEGTTSYFYSYDQNWGTKTCVKIRHNYNYFYGVLRPKDQSKITGKKNNSTTKPVTQIYRIRTAWNKPASQIGAYSSLESAKKNCKSGYSVFDANGNVVYSRQTGVSVGSGTLYKVTANVLNIRAGAGTNHKIVGTIKKNGVYTIVEVSNGWGRLKSGAGWVSMAYMKQY